jgi:hypothetical protein
VLCAGGADLVVDGAGTKASSRGVLVALQQTGSALIRQVHCTHLTSAGRTSALTGRFCLIQLYPLHMVRARWPHLLSALCKPYRYA